MSDEYELDDLPCPQCGYVPTHVRDCTALYCDDTDVLCDTCCGSGIERWCPQCGLDISWWIFEYPGAAQAMFKQLDAAYYADDDPGQRVAPL